MKNIAIAIPCGSGSTDIRFTMSMLAMVSRTKSEMECNITTMTAVRRYHHKARRELAEMFLQTDNDYLLWVDDDQVVESDALIKAMKFLDNEDKTVVSGLYFGRTNNFEPILNFIASNGGSYKDPERVRRALKDREALKVASCGMGFMLMKKEAVQAVKDDYPLMFNVSGIGEDILFCHQLRMAGFTIQVLTDIEVGHIGDSPVITSSDHIDYYEKTVLPVVEKAWKIKGVETEDELKFLAELAKGSNLAMVDSKNKRIKPIMGLTVYGILGDSTNNSTMCDLAYVNVEKDTPDLAKIYKTLRIPGKMVIYGGKDDQKTRDFIIKKGFQLLTREIKGTNLLQISKQ